MIEDLKPRARFLVSCDLVSRAKDHMLANFNKGNCLVFSKSRCPLLPSCTLVSAPDCPSVSMVKAEAFLIVLWHNSVVKRARPADVHAQWP